MKVINILALLVLCAMFLACSEGNDRNKNDKLDTNVINVVSISTDLEAEFPGKGEVVASLNQDWTASLKKPGI